VEAEAVQAGVLEWLCARLDALVAAAQAEPSEARVAAVSEARRVSRTLARCLLAGNACLLAEGVRRGVLSPLLCAFRLLWPAPPYNARTPATWALPGAGAGAGDVEEVLQRAASLDVATMLLRLHPPPGGEPAQAPLELVCIRTGMQLRGGRGAPREGPLSCQLHVVTYAPTKKGAPSQLQPDRPRLEAAAAGGGNEASSSPPRPSIAASPPAQAAAASSRVRCFEGGFVVVRARDAAGHAALIQHAPRLVYLAAAAGAVGVAFLVSRVWAASAVRPLLPNPNLDTPTICPSVILPPTPELEAALDSCSRFSGQWTATLCQGGPSPLGSAADIHAALAVKLRALVAGDAGASGLPLVVTAGLPRSGEGEGELDSPSSQTEVLTLQSPSPSGQPSSPWASASSPSSSPAASARAAGADCWDAAGGGLLLGSAQGEAAGALAAALSVALQQALQLAETGDVSAAATAAAAAAAAVFGSNGSWLAEQAPAAEPVREASARFVASMTPAEQAKAGEAPATPSASGGGGGVLGKPITEPDDPVRAAAAHILNSLGARLSGSGEPSAPPATRPVRILSLDGGGVRGLVELAVLRRILAAAATEAEAKGLTAPTLCELFDIVVGTSTGGVIAAGAVLGMPLDELEQVYRETAAVIFKPESYSSLLRSAYASCLLRAFVLLTPPCLPRLRPRRHFRSGAGGGATRTPGARRGSAALLLGLGGHP